MGGPLRSKDISVPVGLLINADARLRTASSPGARYILAVDSNSRTLWTHVLAKFPNLTKLEGKVAYLDIEES